MHYYIDGYNLMFRVMRAGDELQVQRERIIKDLNTKIQLLALDVTIVFDSHYQYGDLQRTHYNHLEIIFTAQGETADDCILRVIKAAPKPEQCILVTSDKRLAWAARRRLAKTESVEEFLTWLNKRFKNKIRRQKQIKENEPKIIPPIVPRNIESPPVHPPAATPEECFDYYLKIFEAEMRSLEQEERPRKTEEVRFKSRKKKIKPEKKSREEQSLSDMERWLKAFEE